MNFNAFMLCVASLLACAIPCRASGSASTHVSEIKDRAYIDSIVTQLAAQQSAADWEAMAATALRGLEASDDTLAVYPLTYAIFECYAQALNMLTKYAEVEKVVSRGLPYVDRALNPDRPEYYNLRIIGIVAKTLLNDWDSAATQLDELDRINHRDGHGIIDSVVASLWHTVDTHRLTMDRSAKKEEFVSSVINTAAGLMVNAPPSQPEGSQLWRRFFNTTIERLVLDPYDINSTTDERCWSRVLACLIVSFATACDELLGREEVAYDLVLLRKNLLDYHCRALHKKPRRWSDIRDALAPGELAVEITMSPDEILLLGHDFASPVALTIPDSITMAIGGYNSADAVTVNEFYAGGSPLEALLELLGPYLQGISTVYLSPTNIFAPFNYGAAPFRSGRLDDAVNVVQMTTTADIGHCKSNPFCRGNARAILFGGIDYDSSTADSSVTASVVTPSPAAALSEMRGGFGYLPHSRREVEAIGEILTDAEIVSGIGACKQRFKSTDWSTRSPRLLHIATHGYTLPLPTDEERPDSVSAILSVRSRTGLLMAGVNRSLNGQTTGDDGILTSREIAECDMTGVELAVLSSCSSGMGDITNPTGVVYGVANALKSAGAKHLVVTLWDIPDEAAALAMQSFYRHLVQGLSPCEALRHMRQDMIADGYTAPYYWASFLSLD